MSSNSKITLSVRILLGLMMVVFGANKFIHFMEPPLSGEAKEFMTHLVTYGGGYIMITVALVEIIAGLLMLIGRFVPLAAVLLFPVMLNAFMFHLFLDPAGIGGSAVAIAMNIYLFFAYKPSFDPILKP